MAIVAVSVKVWAQIGPDPANRLEGVIEVGIREGCSKEEEADFVGEAYAQWVSERTEWGYEIHKEDEKAAG